MRDEDQLYVHHGEFSDIICARCGCKTREVIRFIFRGYLFLGEHQSNTCFECRRKKFKELAAKWDQREKEEKSNGQRKT